MAWLKASVDNSDFIMSPFKKQSGVSLSRDVLKERGPFQADMGDSVLHQMLEAWHTNNRINLFLIDRISDEGLRCTLSSRGGRDVARQFAHMHDVRVWALQTRAKDLAADLRLFASKESPERGTLKSALIASGDAIGLFLGDVMSGKPKRRGIKKGWLSHLSYFIAHESHHRGSILLTLKQSGHPLDQDTRYAIWNWDKM